MRVWGAASARSIVSRRKVSPNMGAKMQSHAMMRPGGSPPRCRCTSCCADPSSHSRVTPAAAAEGSTHGKSARVMFGVRGMRGMRDMRAMRGLDGGAPCAAASCGCDRQPSSASSATTPLSVSSTGDAPSSAHASPGSPSPQPSSTTLVPRSVARHAGLASSSSVTCTAESQMSVPVHEPSAQRAEVGSTTSLSHSAIGSARCAMNAGTRSSHHSSSRSARRTPMTATSRSTPITSGSMQPLATSFWLSRMKRLSNSSGWTMCRDSHALAYLCCLVSMR
mmetsp:Transcript_50817/g.168328  ORF Transcript_50817/g.168328 Transcript_50817/m.168328 type:complete len:279 (-) Transcript_50817:219-1055(-)